jgi:AraC family transcriptional regulator of adaptative response/methylated-DNA-[protein]-cysteine methyltransferase
MNTTGEVFGYAAGESVLGTILVVTSEQGVVGSFTGEPLETLLLRAKRRFHGTHLKAGANNAKKALAEAFKIHADPSRLFTFPLDIRTTPFRKAVLQAIMDVPPGEFSTYKDIARLAGSPRAMRAVGSTCTENDFMGIVPCHRILHTNENFTTNKDKGALHRHARIQREMAFVTPAKKKKK